MFKRKLILGALLGLSGLANATTDSATIQLTADIPDSTFHVRPTTPISGDVAFSYNFATSELDDIKIPFTYTKPANNKVTVKLAATPQLHNGSDGIPLTVSLGGKNISTTAADVVAKDDSDSGNLELLISADSVSGKSGSYSSTLELSFEASLVP